MRTVRTALIVILVLLLAALVPLMVWAQEAPADESALAPLMEKLFLPGVLGGVVGVVLSFVVDFVPGYEKLNGKLKRLVFFGIALVISGGAGALIPILQGQPPQWDPILANAIVASLAAWGGGTLAHTRELPS